MTATNETGRGLRETGRPDAVQVLATLDWRADAPSPLVKAAASGDLGKFCRALRKSWPRAWRERAKDDARWKLAATFDPSAFALTEGERQLLQISSWLHGDCPGEEESRSGADSHAPSTSNGQKVDSGIGANGSVRHRSNGRNETASGKETDEESVWRTLELWLLRSARASAIETLHLLDIIAHRATAMPYGVLFGTWAAALAGARELAAFLTDPAGVEPPFGQGLVICGEVAWKAGLLFGLLEGMDELRDTGREHLCSELRRATSSAGIPSPEFRDRWPSSLFTVIRAAQWGDEFRTVESRSKSPNADVPPLDATTVLFVGDEDSERFAALVRSAVMLSRGDGRPALSESDRLPSGAPAMLDDAARIAGLKKKSRVRTACRALQDGAETESARRPGKAVRRLSRGNQQGKRPVFQSDESLLACLRTDWSPTADLIAVSHSQSEPRISLCAMGLPVFEGLCERSLRIDGTPIGLDVPWKATCWFSDKDGDYLEIQQTLDGGVHLERQILLSRDRRFAVLADCISGTGDRPIEYRTRLPLASPLMESTTDAESRECRLIGGSTVVRAVPAGLECDRVRSCAGSLSVVDGALQLEQQGAGGLFAPIVLDWEPSRTRKPADWRTLTVAENGAAVRPSVAAGHRVRIGDHQVLIYRSLRRSDERRTVLGLHTPNETVIALLESDGELKPLLMVE